MPNREAEAQIEGEQRVIVEKVMFAQEEIESIGIIWVQDSMKKKRVV